MGWIVHVTGPPGFVSWHLSGEETNFCLYDRRQWCRIKVPTELRPLSFHRDWRTEQELSPACLFFIEMALRSLRKQLWVVDLHVKGQRKDL